MRRTGYNYETIKKYLGMEDFNEPFYPSREYSSLLNLLKPVIAQWLSDALKALRKQRNTEKCVYERILEEYPEQLEVKQHVIQ